MRAAALGSLTASVLVAATLAVTAPTAASASAAPDDWRAAACKDADRDLAVGAYAVTSRLAERLEDLPSVTVTAERLTFANGARCDLLHLHGRLPVERQLRGHSAEVSTLGELVVAGASQGEMASHTVASGAGGNIPIRDVDHLVLGAVTFRDVESGTMPDTVVLPEPWRNQPYAFTHTRTTYTVKLVGKVGSHTRFTVTPATRAAARRRLTQDLTAAQNGADRRAARHVFRLALRGIRLDLKTFRARWSGELPR